MFETYEPKTVIVLPVAKRFYSIYYKHLINESLGKANIFLPSTTNSCSSDVVTVKYQLSL